MGKKKEPKLKKPTRDEVARHNLKEKMKAREGKIITHLESYCKHIITGRYFLARVNMMAAQLEKGKILESIDGAPKPREFFIAELAKMRQQAIISHRHAFFEDKSLKMLGCKQERINNALTEYYEGKVMREWDDIYQAKNRAAEFIE